MPYCSSTGKLEGHDDADIGIDGEDAACDDAERETDVTVTFDVTVNLLCNGCGQPSKTGDFSGQEVEVPHACPPEEDGGPTDEALATRAFSVSLGDPELSERSQEKDRHGKPITRSRYRKTYRGFTVVGTIACSACGGEDEFEASDDMPASGFEETGH